MRKKIFEKKKEEEDVLYYQMREKKEIDCISICTFLRAIRIDCTVVMSREVYVFLKAC